VKLFLGVRNRLQRYEEDVTWTRNKWRKSTQKVHIAISCKDSGKTWVRCKNYTTIRKRTTNCSFQHEL